VDAARALFERVLKDYADSPDAPAALEHLADLARNEGHQGQAEQTYRELLNRWPSLNGTTGMAEVSLAELLLDGGGKEAADEAVRLLNSAIARGGPITFNANLFRWHIALVRAAELLGDRETVRRAARTALDLADRPPQFPRHPSVGVVSADSELLRWLRRRAEL
jgi:predicted Zn-dependent protease